MPAAVVKRLKKAESTARQAVLEAARTMGTRGLSPSRSGNVSMRFGDGMMITPSGMPYDQIDAGDMVFVSGTGKPEKGARKPSSEWRFHLAAYHARPDCNGVVHSHSTNATALACAHKPIPAFHYMVAAAGGSDIPLIPYATFGTEALADLVAAGLKQRNACLMANHGQIAIGATLEAALELAFEVEMLAEQYVKTLSVGPAKLLSEPQMAEALARFKTYGQRTQNP